MTSQIEEMLREGGYLVDVSFKKVGNNITISPNILGIEVTKNEELGAFFDQFVKNSQISWLGKRNKEIKKAESIAKSVHKRKIRDSLDGKHYMPKSKLPEFKSFLKVKTEEYMKIRDNLIDAYDLNVRQFEEKLRNDFLKETVTDTEEREKVIKAIMNKVPSIDKLEKSFKIEKSYMLFAMASELADEDDKQASIDSAQSKMSEINGRTLAVIFDKVNIVMKALVDGKYTKKHDKILNEVSDELIVRNIFNHSTISEIYEEFMQVKDEHDLDEYEMIIGKIFKFSKEIDETHQLNLDQSILDYSQLEFLAKAVG